MFFDHLIISIVLKVAEIIVFEVIISLHRIVVGDRVVLGYVSRRIHEICYFCLRSMYDQKCRKNSCLELLMRFCSAESKEKYVF